MATLVLANASQTDAIYRQSHAVWGAGLSPASYRQMWREIAETPWAMSHLEVVVWADDCGNVLSSCKVYRVQVRWHGSLVDAVGIGAVFTPRAQRGQGHGHELLQRVLQTASERGAALALLFSDIDPRYYRALGFESLAAEEQWGRLPRRCPMDTSPWTLSPAEAEDWERIREAHQRTHAHRDLAVQRDVSQWHFLGVRAESYFRQLGDRERSHRVWVASERGRFAGFLIAAEGPREWSVRELGAVDGDPQRLTKILRVGAAAARDGGRRRFYAWLPPEVRQQLEDWRIYSRRRSRAIPMFKVLDPGALAQPLSRAPFIPFQDQF